MDIPRVGDRCVGCCCFNRSSSPGSPVAAEVPLTPEGVRRRIMMQWVAAATNGYRTTTLSLITVDRGIDEEDDVCHNNRGVLWMQAVQPFSCNRTGFDPDTADFNFSVTMVNWRKGMYAGGWLRKCGLTMAYLGRTPERTFAEWTSSFLMCALFILSSLHFSSS